MCQPFMWWDVSCRRQFTYVADFLYIETAKPMFVQAYRRQVDPIDLLAESALMHGYPTPLSDDPLHIVDVSEVLLPTLTGCDR